MSPLFPALMISLSTPLMALAEWNQWRGAGRNGICLDSSPLVDSLPSTSLPVLWQSDPIPSDHDGGHASPVTAAGKVYLNLVWHTHVPSESRVIEEDHLVSLGYRETSLLGKVLLEKLESTRKTTSPSLRGEALQQWIRQWVQDHFNEEQRLVLGSWAEWRLGQKAAAVDLDVLALIHPRVGKPFPSHLAMVQWLNEQKISEDVQEKLLKLVPSTVKEAQDVVLCLDLESGKTLWKAAFPGKPTGRAGSSTCAVVDGTVYSLGSTHVHALDAASGKVRWQKKLAAPGGGSSPLVLGNKVWIWTGSLLCLSAGDGSVLWENRELKSSHSSPVLWQPSSGPPALLCLTASRLVALDPESGALLWDIPGGGPSSPVVTGDYLIVFTEAKEAGLQCFRASVSGPPQKLWNHWWLASRHSSSPLVHEGNVYLMEGGRHLCIGLQDGATRWQEMVESTISSPVLGDGKIFNLEQNGMFLRMIKADPAAYDVLGRTKVEAMWCPTPLITQGRLVLRRNDRLVCLDLRR